MKKLFSALTSRMFLVMLAIVAQLAWMMVYFTVLQESYELINIISMTIAVIVALFIVNKYDNPSYKTAWLLLVLILPLLGILFYIFFGNKRPMRRMKRVMEPEIAKVRELKEQDRETIYQLEKKDPHLGSLSKYIMNTAGDPVFTGSDTKYYPSGEGCFEDMLTELRGAKKYIFIEYFIIAEGYMWSAVLSILRDKIKEGVDVRVIYDDFGCLKYLPRKYYKKLIEMGIKTIVFNRFYPIFSVIQNNRDHRKFFIVDGHTAFTGGLNLADEYINKIEKFGYWKDGCLRVKGSAVWPMTLTFISMWNSYSDDKLTDLDQYRPDVHKKSVYTGPGFVQPYQDSPIDDEPVGENVYLNIIQNAVKYVYIFTPYLIIDHDCIESLRSAARRGVDVKIILPGIPDKKIIYGVTKTYFHDLLAAGVKIYLYKPGFIHSKCFVSDDKVATVGSINMDFRSLYLHFENGVVLYNTLSVADVKKDALETINVSEEVPENFREGITWGIISSVARLLAPMM